MPPDRMPWQSYADRREEHSESKFKNRNPRTSPSFPLTPNEVTVLLTPFNGSWVKEGFLPKVQFKFKHVQE
jgi:hypothetical protein